MTFRRLLGTLLLPVVLLTGLAAVQHTHSSDVGPGAHDAGACAVCRLAHESAPAALPPMSLPDLAATWHVDDLPSLLTHDGELDFARSPRAPPRPALG